MTRNRIQSGWVEVRGKKPRKWVGFFYVTVDGERRRREVRLGLKSELTKGEAEQRLRDQLGGSPLTRTTTFGDAAAKYLKLKSADWSPIMSRTMASIFDNQISPALGRYIASEIKPTTIKEFFGEVAAKYSESTTKKCITHTRAVFDMLSEDGVLGRSPAKKSALVKTPKMRKPSERFASVLEAQAVIAAARERSLRDYVIVRIGFAAGLRPGEIFALRLEDIRPGQLWIDESATPGQPIGDPKTDGSVAFVPISPELEAEIREHIFAAGIVDPRAFLFANRRGHPINGNNYRRRQMGDFATAAGIKDKINFQVARRTVGTHMQDHGEAKATQGLLRHSSAETTLKHYQKRLDPTVVKAAESWDKALMMEEKIYA